jgi:hypothetical protein
MIQNRKNAMMEFCYKFHFHREFRTFTKEDVRKFELKHFYFLEDVNGDDALLFEFASFHFHKWIRLMGLGFSKREIREFLIGKLS